MNSSTQRRDHANSSQSQGAYLCAGLRQLEWITRHSITGEKRELLRRYQQLKPAYNGMMVFFLIQWLAAGMVMSAVDFLPVTLLCSLLMGFSVVGLPILMHEACHSLLSRNPMVNRWLGFLCGVPGLVSVSAYRSIHLIHHSHTRTDQDPDNIEQANGVPLPKVFLHYLVLVAGIYFYIPTVAVTGYKKGRKEMKSAILVEYSLMLAIVAGAYILFPLESLVRYWLIPLLIAAQLSNVRGLAEHGLMSTGNPFVDTRTVLSNRFVSFMMCNLNYHLEHHLFPGIPWYNLPKVHRLLRDEFQKAGASLYRSYSSFLADFFKVTWSEPLRTDARLLPAHIRDEVCL
ncbi:MAG: fatty acid desaturase family protein [Ignavibacteriales bacterium]|nr:fatty acid desaturase family protein [Ignavibacteriales bacterium]